MDSQRQQASERIKQANNILVTVSSNPSVDQLAACIGLTLSLNKMGKHATAVFSGEIPSTLEFLQPEKTLEKNTDSLRDFIIALDKSKADKLRYKVEDRVVKIFITPYRTSISDKDLEFSQGDFNVDVIVALGVHNQAELDQAITSHGRILHDATIVTINVKPGGDLGSINWLDPSASSLSELSVELIDMLDKKLIDGQVATAFLTGIVAETDRFSNAKTTPQTMSISAQLMSEGANQQLVATKLEEPAPMPMPPAPIAQQPNSAPSTEPAAPLPAPIKRSNDGTLEIAHDETKSPEDEMLAEDQPATSGQPLAMPDFNDAPIPEEKPQPQEPVTPPPQIHIDEHGSLVAAEDKGDDSDGLPPLEPATPPEISRHKMMLEPPTLDGGPKENTDPFSADAGSGLPGMPASDPDDEKPSGAAHDQSEPATGNTITPPSEQDEPINAPGTSFLGDQPLLESQPKPIEAGKTLSDIEREVHSNHLNQQPEPVQQPITVVPPTQEPNVVDPITQPFIDTMLPPVTDNAPAPLFNPAQPQNDDDVSSVPDMPIGNDTTPPPNAYSIPPTSHK